MHPLTKLLAAVLLVGGLLCSACRLPRRDAVAAPPARPQPIALTNYAGGTTIRYPVALLRGTLADEEATSVTVVNTSSKRETRELRGLVHHGRFIALAELVPGENKLVLRAAEHELPLTLHYKPQTNPYLVRVVYFTDKDGHTDYQTPVADDAQDFRGKLDTAMKLLQTFTAESLHDQGLGRRTFRLELDDRGRVRVHVLSGDRSMAEYHKLNGNQLYGHIAGRLRRRFRRDEAHYLVIPAFTRFDPGTKKVYAHTALGGGNLALFGGGNLFAWPSSLAEAQARFLDATRVDTARFFSDSVGRHTFWAIASTTIGASLHELGHTFGLPHSRDPHDIMTRGIDRLNRFFTFVEPPHVRRGEPYEFRSDEVGYWAPVSAAALAPIRHFALDAREWKDEPKTAIRLNAKTRRIEVESDYGLRFVGVYLTGKDIGTVAGCHLPLAWAKAPPTRLDVPLAELGKRVGTDSISLRVIDDQGLTTWASVKQLLAGPSVRAWRFASITQPWRDAKAFPPVDAAKLEAVVASAAQAKLVTSRTPFVDFLPRFGEDEEAHTAGYAVRTIRCDEPRKVKILTGSDDALRLWLNGEVIQQVLELRSASPDAESVVAGLREGENVLVAEVANASGGWGLLLRLEDGQGNPLELADDGTLSTISGETTRRLRRLLFGPFVRDWRFAAITHPWGDKGSFVLLDAATRQGIEEAAASAELKRGALESVAVDFLPYFPKGRRANVAGYAFRVLRSERPRKVRLVTGSDDALRMWLNGELIQSVLALRGATPDCESAEAHLRAGENRLLVEVSQGLGDWGLVLRIEDADGTDLELAPDGRLVPFGAAE